MERGLTIRSSGPLRRSAVLSCGGPRSGVRLSMERITNQITSLEWWFTVVLVGLIVSVLGSFARDWIGKVLSTTSTRLARMIRIRRARRKLRIRFLSNASEYLQFEYSRAIVDLLYAVSLLGFSFLVPAWDTLVRFFPEVDPLGSTFGIFQFPSVAKPLLYIAVLVGALYQWNRFLSRYVVCEKARHLRLRRSRPASVRFASPLFPRPKA